MQYMYVYKCIQIKTETREENQKKVKIQKTKIYEFYDKFLVKIKIF